MNSPENIHNVRAFLFLAIIILAIAFIASIPNNLTGDNSITGQVIYDFSFNWKPDTSAHTIEGSWLDFYRRFRFTRELGTSSILRWKARDNNKIEFAIPAFERNEEVISISPEFYISTDRFQLKTLIKGENRRLLREHYVDNLECTPDDYMYHDELRPVYHCKAFYDGDMYNHGYEGQVFRIDLDENYKNIDVLVYDSLDAVVEYRK